MISSHEVVNLSGEGALVLVVEDDEDLLDALCESLRLEGIECVEARTGLRALELMRSGCRPSVVLLDLRMPGMDGLEFLRRRREAQPEGDLAPVLLLSGDPNPVEDAARLGLAGSVRKPVTMDALLDTLKPFVSRAGARP